MPVDIPTWSYYLTEQHASREDNKVVTNRDAPRPSQLHF